MKILNLKRRISMLVSIGAISLIFGSCYPDNGDIYTGDLDTVLTLFDETVDFTQFNTYAMPDTIVNICDDDSSADCIDLKDTYDDEILNLIAQNLEALGYTREMNPETNGADVFVFVSKVGTKNVDAYYYPWWGYWGWYGGWGYPGYPGYPGGGWYPYYPWYGSTVVYTYTTGSVLVEMIDPNSGDTAAGTVNTVWAGGINGLVESSDVASRLQKNINQMFAQSPYLKTN